MSKTTVEYIVYVCLLVVLYHNWTDFPRPFREAHGPLIKIGEE